MAGNLLPTNILAFDAAHDEGEPAATSPNNLLASLVHSPVNLEGSAASPSVTRPASPIEQPGNQESRSSSLSLALSTTLSWLSTLHYQNDQEEIQYPNLEPLSPKLSSIPGAFPDTPVRRTALELPPLASLSHPTNADIHSSFETHERGRYATRPGHPITFPIRRTQSQPAPLSQFSFAFTPQERNEDQPDASTQLVLPPALSAPPSFTTISKGASIPTQQNSLADSSHHHSLSAHRTESVGVPLWTASIGNSGLITSQERSGEVIIERAQDLDQHTTQAEQLLTTGLRGTVALIPSTEDSAHTPRLSPRELALDTETQEDGDNNDYIPWPMPHHRNLPVDHMLDNDSQGSLEAVGPIRGDPEPDDDDETRTQSAKSENSGEMWSLYESSFSEDPYRPIPDLPESLCRRNPVIVAHAPSHQNLWDRLPWGTIWNVAMAAQKHNIDLDAIPAQELERMLGKNLSFDQVETILGIGSDHSASIAKDRKTMEELDWEAEKVVAGDGEMLGCSEERDVRYGGKVQFSALLKLKTLPPKSDNASIIDLQDHSSVSLEPLSLTGSCIFTRVFGSHRFLRVRISEDIQNEVSVFRSDAATRRNNRYQLRAWAARPLVILGRVYAPLVPKDGVVHYFLEGDDQVGEMFEKGKEYGIPGCRTVRQLLEWWVPFEFNGSQPMSKLVTRLELGISDTLPGIFIEPENIAIVEDIVNKKGIEFTDGAGLITLSVAKALARKYGTAGSPEVVFAYQIRIKTAKGVVLVDPTMLHERKLDGPHRIWLYRSMCKAKYGNHPPRPGPVNGLSILDAAACMLCIVKPAPSSSAQGARLSGQFITILSDCGVPNEVILRLQSEALKKQLALWTDVSVEQVANGESRLDEASRLRLARLIGKSQGLSVMMKRKDLAGEARGRGYGKRRNRRQENEDTTDDEESDRQLSTNLESLILDTSISRRPEELVELWSHNEISGLPGLKPQALQGALYAGIEVHKSAYFLDIWNSLVEDAMFNIVSKFHPTVERSASGFFQPDPTGLLKEGEVFFAPTEDMYDPDSGQRVNIVIGDVLIGRHPALLPTDLQKVKAVPIHSLEPFRGIVFCSVHGKHPLASLCAGGDYDGDEAMIIWELEVVDSFQNAPLELRDPPAEFMDRFEFETSKVEETQRELATTLDDVEYSMKLSLFLVASVGEGETFKIYNQFYRKATYKYGLRGVDENGSMAHSALMMAHCFNTLMDAKKTGLKVKDEILKEDKEFWSYYTEPRWREFCTKKTSNFNQAILQPKDGISPILDLLREAGMREVSAATEIIQPDKTESKLFFNGSGKDEDLLRPWVKAQDDVNRMATSNPNIVYEFEAILKSVKHSMDRFKKMKQQWKQFKGRKGVQELRDICRELSLNPPQEKVPSFVVFGGDEVLRNIKASYAYALDMGIPSNNLVRGGYQNGFCWHVAMRDLFTIKAKAISNQDTFTMPHSIRDRMEPPKLFA